MQIFAIPKRLMVHQRTTVMKATQSGHVPLTKVTTVVDRFNYLGTTTMDQLEEIMVLMD